MQPEASVPATSEKTAAILLNVMKITSSFQPVRPRREEKAERLHIFNNYYPTASKLP
jgi:hypothetical protein